MLIYYMSVISDENDRALFDRIYKQYEHDIFKRIMKIVKNQQDAEDVMQETWFSIAKNMEIFRTMEQDMMEAYIFRTARNRAIDFYRVKKKERYFSCDMEKVNLEDSYDYESILLNLCAKTDVQIIAECIHSMEPAYSDVLQYFYFYQHTIKEIATLLKLKETTVGVRLYRGRLRLLRLLERRNLNDRE